MTLAGLPALGRRAGRADGAGGALPSKRYYKSHNENLTIRRARGRRDRDAAAAAALPRFRGTENEFYRAIRRRV